MKQTIPALVMAVIMVCAPGCEFDDLDNPVFMEFINRSSYTVTVEPINQDIAPFNLAPDQERQIRRSEVRGNTLAFNYAPSQHVRADTSHPGLVVFTNR